MSKKVKLPKVSGSVEEFAAKLAADDAAMKELKADENRPSKRSNPFEDLDKDVVIKEDQIELDDISEDEDDSNEDLDDENIEDEDLEEEDSDRPDVDKTEDWILDESDTGGIVKQEDHTITWNFDGLINPKTGKPYNRFYYMENPVIMKFVAHQAGDTEGDNDALVNMVITQNMAKELAFYFNNVYRAYAGMALQKDKTSIKDLASPSGIKQRFLDAWEDHPAKLVAEIAVTVAVIGFFVYSVLF